MCQSPAAAMATNPEQCYWAKERRNNGCSAPLHRKEREQNEQRQRDHVGFERGGEDLEAFDCRQDGESRRDDRIAIEQGAADDSEQDDHSARGRTMGERHQSQGATLAVVIRAQQDGDIFIETTRIRDQMISDNIPRMTGSVAGVWAPPPAARTDSRMA
jgi:hypothetical protein